MPQRAGEDFERSGRGYSPASPLLGPSPAVLANIGMALGFALLAAQALTAFLIIGLGALIGSFWGSALIVGVLFLVIAGVLGKSAASKLQERNPVPEATMETLREEARWAKQEAQEFRMELRR